MSPHVTPTVRHTNHRVIIEPRRLGDYGWMRTSDRFGGIPQEQVEKEYQERCEEIADQARRHCDNVARAYVETDKEENCPHCGHAWMPDKDGLNQCCNTEIRAWALANPLLASEVLGADWEIVYAIP